MPPAAEDKDDNHEGFRNPKLTVEIGSRGANRGASPTSVNSLAPIEARYKLSPINQTNAVSPTATNDFHFGKPDSPNRKL